METVEFKAVTKGDKGWITPQVKGFLFEHRGLLFVVHQSFENRDKGLFTVSDYSAGGRVFSYLSSNDIDELVKEFKKVFDERLKLNKYSLADYKRLRKEEVRNVGVDYPVNTNHKESE